MDPITPAEWAAGFLAMLGVGLVGSVLTFLVAAWVADCPLRHIPRRRADRR